MSLHRTFVYFRVLPQNLNALIELVILIMLLCLLNRVVSLVHSHAHPSFVETGLVWVVVLGEGAVGLPVEVA